MLTPDKITSIFCLIEDILIGIGHDDAPRRKVSDSEIIITAIMAAKYFGGNQFHDICFIRDMYIFQKC